MGLSKQEVEVAAEISNPEMLNEALNRAADITEKEKVAFSQGFFRTAQASFDSGQTEDALNSLNKALELDRKNVRALVLKADILAYLGEFDAAADLCRRVFKLEPQHFDAHNLMNSIGKGTSFQDSVASAYSSELRRAAARHLSTAKYLNLHSRFEQSIKYVQSGVQLLEVIARDDTDDLLQRLVLEQVYALEMLGRLTEAIECLETIEGVGTPDKTIAPKARCEMERGNFQQAYRLFGLDDAEGVNADRFIKEAIPILYGIGDIGEAHARYRLRGSSKTLKSSVNAVSVHDVSLRKVAGSSIFLFSESGPGDEIRFSTLYGELSAMFDPTTITCEPRLQSILSRSYPDIHFIPTERHRKELRRGAVVGRDKIKDKALRQFATDDLLMRASEADIVGTTLDILADLRKARSDFGRPCLLRADPERANSLASMVTPGVPKIGISWRSMLQSSARDRHYFRPEDFRQLIDIPNAEFWVLQAGVNSEEYQALQAVLPNTRLSEDIDLVDDFEGQAALLMNMDVVISPFTSMAELSGALGRPTIMLSNSYQTTWRRNEDGTDIWHPTAFVAGANTIGNREGTIREAVALVQGLNIPTVTVSADVT